MFDYPLTEHGLYRWICLIAGTYIVTAYVLRVSRSRRWDIDHLALAGRVFDGMTFATSIAVLWGFFDEAILKLLGSTTSFLLLAGFAGVGYGIVALFRNSA